MKIYSNYKYLIFRIFIALFVIVSAISCEYDKIEIDLPDPGEPVSFAADILPIFTNGNNCTACHASGSISPDLTASKAFESIVPALINTEEPESSKIYAYPQPGTPSHSFKKYTHVQAALVLSWIKQGAENN